MIEKQHKIYSKQEVLKATLEYFNGDELAADVWIKKYCLKDDKNYYELTPDDMHRRIAKELARIELKYPHPLSEEQIYQTLKDFKRIIPQGSPMSGIGNNLQISSIGNCFVIGNEYDSYGSILNIDQEQVQLMKRRGGVGHDLSKIRPSSLPVKNDALTSTGIVPFMERYSNTTKEVAQSGRRGALMLSLSIKHPESESFIDAKLENGKVTGANISVKIDDEFMNSVINNTEYVQQFPIDSESPKIIKKISAKKLWDKIIHNAWSSAEPGILFWDTLRNESISSCYGEKWIETSTNPCGELPLPPYDSCRLLAINLFEYVENPFTKNSVFNWDLFQKDIIFAQRYMDDIVDLEIEKVDKILEKVKLDPEPDDIKYVERELWTKIKTMVINGRRTGLGITGEGDMIAAMGFRYGTDDATNFAVKVHQFLKTEAYRSSIIMARERGAFPIFSTKCEENNPFILRIKEESPSLYKDMVKFGRRNISLLTIAPTGTVSIMTQTSSGIECCFAVYYMRRRKINPQEKDVRVDFIDMEGISWQEYPVFHHKFEMWLEVNGYDVNTVKLLRDDELQEIIKKSPYYRATANDVDWVKKVEMQGRIQQSVDHSISCTINVPNDVSENLISKIYETGWRTGCKGITVYRDGSRSGVLITNEKKETEFHENHAPKRPKRLKGEIHRFQNNLEKWIAVAGLKDGRPYELFTGKLENGLSKLPSNVKECEVVKNIIEGENGEKIKRYDIEYVDNDGVKQTHTGLNQAFNPEYWNYAKLISGILRHGMPLIKVYELIDSLTFREENINTWKNGVIRVIKKYIKDGEKTKGLCPECGGDKMEFKEGCVTCVSCSWSKCS